MLPDLDAGLQQSSAYATKDFETEVAGLLRHPGVSVLHPDGDTFRLVEEVFANTRLAQRDSLDAYFLTCVLRSARDLPADTPRIFMSLNHRDFSPVSHDKGHVPPVPQELYDRCRVVYLAQLSLGLGLRLWRERFRSR